MVKFGGLEGVIKDKDWQVSDDELFRKKIQPPRYFANHEDVTVVIKKLNNGLYVATVLNPDNHLILANANYDTDGLQIREVSLIKLVMDRSRGLPGFRATFEYHSGEYDEQRLETAWLEYTIWHNPSIGEAGLATLIGMHADHKIPGDNSRIRIDIGTKTFQPFDRQVILELTPPDGGKLEFDTEGKLIRAPLAYEASDRIGYPLRGVYHATRSGARVDTLKTAETLLFQLSSFGNFDIEHSIQYR